MDLLIVTGFRRSSDLPRQTDADAKLQEAFVAAGHSVRWMLPVPKSRPSTRDGMQQAPVSLPHIPVPCQEPGFRQVQGRLADAGFERTFSVTVRSQPPDLVFLSDYGGNVPWALPWIAQRLGTRIVVSAQAAPVLCHRGSLMHGDGSACAVFDDAKRCVDCCLIHTSDGLSAGQARVARLLRLLGGFSPFPSEVQFKNRLDMVVHGLAQADAVLVEDDAAAERFTSVGVPKRVLRVVPQASRDPALLLDVFHGICRAEPSR